MTTKKWIASAGVLVAVGLAPLPSHAGNQRTFVSANGVDTNPCSLAAPCRTFGIALGQTNAGGEIVVLDSGGYGSTSINKAVSIVVPQGIYAGVSVFAATDGFVISAGPTDEVVLRGLTINNQGGNNGIVFNTGAALYVESCTIRGFTGGSMGSLWRPGTSLGPEKARPHYTLRLGGRLSASVLNFHQQKQALVPAASQPSRAFSRAGFRSAARRPTKARFPGMPCSGFASRVAETGSGLRVR